MENQVKLSCFRKCSTAVILIKTSPDLTPEAREVSTITLKELVHDQTSETEDMMECDSTVWSFRGVRSVHLHLSVSIFVRMATSLALPPQLLQLWLTALDGLHLRLPLALVLLQRRLDKGFHTVSHLSGQFHRVQEEEHLDHQTSLKRQFFEIGIYASYERWVNNISIDVWFGQYL